MSDLSGGLSVKSMSVEIDEAVRAITAVVPGSGVSEIVAALRWAAELNLYRS
jgi:hypothetical protein